MRKILKLDKIKKYNNIRYILRKPDISRLDKMKILGVRRDRTRSKNFTRNYKSINLTRHIVLCINQSKKADTCLFLVLLLLCSLTCCGM